MRFNAWIACFSIVLAVSLGSISKSFALEPALYNGEVGGVRVSLQPDVFQNDPTFIAGSLGNDCGEERAGLVDYEAKWSNPTDGVLHLTLAAKNGVVSSGDLTKRIAAEDGLRFVEWSSTDFFFNGGFFKGSRRIALRRVKWPPCAGPRAS
jgi:hypothetical protein